MFEFFYRHSHQQNVVELKSCCLFRNFRNHLGIIVNITGTNLHANIRHPIQCEHWLQVIVATIIVEDFDFEFQPTQLFVIFVDDSAKKLHNN